MRKYGWLLCLCSLITVEGCGRSSEATAQPKRPTSRRLRARQIWPSSAFVQPGENAASTMPAADKGLLEQVKVEVEEVEPDFLVHGESRSFAGEVLVAVKVKVTSNLEGIRLQVGPHRFTLEAEDGERMALNLSSRREPLLPHTYVKAGESVEGWLTFRVPKDIKRFFLKSDLRKPYLSVVVQVSD
jgi:hypothetical protein